MFRRLPLRNIFQSPKATGSRAGRFLGFYLLSVFLCQLVFAIWSQLRWHSAPAWSRQGWAFFLALMRNGEPRPADYYLISFVGLIFALVFLQGRLPLKSYLACEFILAAPTAILLLISDNMKSDLRTLLFFIFESAVPMTFVVVLLWRRAWKVRPVPVHGTRMLGYYLLCVSLYQAVYFIVKGLLLNYSRLPRIPSWFIMLAPRMGLSFVGQQIEDALNLEVPGAVYITLWVFGLVLAILLIAGRQPLKTYVFFESFLASPGLVLAIVIALSPLLTVGWLDRLEVLFVFIFESAISFCFAIALLWRRRKVLRDASRLVPAS